MDPVRFGRALGIGARLAAKTAVTAVDAALAPNPNGSVPTPTNPAASAVRVRASNLPPNPNAAASAGRVATPTKTSTRPSPRGLVHALSAPVRRLSSVLWLEFTGVFFGLFALTAAVGAWRLRAAWHLTPTNASDHLHLLMTLAVALLFAYFCASSFLRARRRGAQF